MTAAYRRGHRSHESEIRSFGDSQRTFNARFISSKDALTLTDLDRRFDTVIDSGLFHVFSDEDRACYVAGLAHVAKPGGRPEAPGKPILDGDDMRARMGSRKSIEY